MGWYEHELRWPVAEGLPPGLVTGVRFDALDVPAEAGFAILGRFSRPDQLGPVALDGHRIRLLTAAGTAEELPGLLEWLEWGGIRLDLAALGAGQTMRAPAHPEWARREAAYDRSAPVWLRPPGRGSMWNPPCPHCGSRARPMARGNPSDCRHWSPPWRRPAIGSRCERAGSISRGPSRTPHGWSPGPGRGH